MSLLESPPSPRVIKSPTGSQLSCRSWLTEAPLRMLMNNLDPEVAERPEDLVVYGGIGRAARTWAALQQDLSARARQGKAVNLDPAGLILDMLWRIEDTARMTAPA